MTFTQLESAVIEWAVARQIIPNSTSTAQFLKAVSEMGELADAINKNDRAGIIDAIGDTLVCLINLCQLEGIDITVCLACAYNEIKDRKGTLLSSGAFVKEDK